MKEIAERIALARRRMARLPRYYSILLAVGVVLVAFAVASEFRARRAQRLLRSSRAELARFNEFRDLFVKGRTEFAPSERRLLTPQVKESIGAIVEDVCVAVGINKSITSVKSAEADPVKGYNVSGAEFHIDGITLNQAVNLLYRIENHPNMLMVRELSIRSRFNDPNILDLTLRVYLTSRAA